MFKIGDTITLGDKVGKVTGVHIDSRIGFLCEGKRKHTYTIEFNNIPEDEIELKNGSTDSKSNELPLREERKPD